MESVNFKSNINIDYLLLYKIMTYVIKFNLIQIKKNKVTVPKSLYKMFVFKIIYY